MIRTDLALEVRESFPEDDVELRGVILEKEEEGDVTITRLEICDKQGERAMGKPKGTYITIEIGKDSKDETKQKEIICRCLTQLLEISGKHIMVAGLGNREITPDALGPSVVDQLIATRHLILEFGEEFQKTYHLEALSMIAPGVMGQTGIETKDVLKGIIRQTKPDCLVVIDALAARNVNRLTRTVQITDTGIHPGAGVGNNRGALNEKSLGVPVIAIGVPTVVDANTIIQDCISEILEKRELAEEEKKKFQNELMLDQKKNLFVTPRDIDESIHKMSKLLSDSFGTLFYEALLD